MLATDFLLWFYGLRSFTLQDGFVTHRHSVASPSLLPLPLAGPVEAMAKFCDDQYADCDLGEDNDPSNPTATQSMPATHWMWIHSPS